MVIGVFRPGHAPIILQRCPLDFEPRGLPGTRFREIRVMNAEVLGHLVMTEMAVPKRAR
jgi:hypothetical protein